MSECIEERYVTDGVGCVECWCDDWVNRIILITVRDGRIGHQGVANGFKAVGPNTNRSRQFQLKQITDEANMGMHLGTAPPRTTTTAVPSKHPRSGVSARRLSMSAAYIA